MNIYDKPEEWRTATEQALCEKLARQGAWKSSGIRMIPKIGQTKGYRGRFIVTDVYDPVYQKQITMHESPAGKSYF